MGTYLLFNFGEKQGYVPYFFRFVIRLSIRLAPLASAPGG
jgi:hypothetical protein